ncbi:MAG TPA: TraR/DksA C4-type zinc finger protein [Natronosporangium sp.]|nr:TraR/DksA C4-type zinc finger protein [Natronosporangium sp.]
MTTDIRDNAEHDWIETVRAKLTSELDQHQARLAELSTDTSDPSEAHHQVALVAATRESIARVTEALRRISEGSYGICEKCSNRIPQERLEVLPHARFCVPCQEKHGA